MNLLQPSTGVPSEISTAHQLIRSLEQCFNDDSFVFITYELDEILTKHQADAVTSIRQSGVSPSIWVHQLIAVTISERLKVGGFQTDTNELTTTGKNLLGLYDRVIDELAKLNHFSAKAAFKQRCALRRELGLNR
jgi:hypothetical protein